VDDVKSDAIITRERLQEYYSTNMYEGVLIRQRAVDLFMEMESAGLNATDMESRRYAMKSLAMTGYWEKSLGMARGMLETSGVEGQDHSPPLTASALPLPEILEAAARVSGSLLLVVINVIHG